MSRGVHSRFPCAYIFHYLDEKDENANCGQRENFEKKMLKLSPKKVIVVDSVINSGKSIQGVLKRLQDFQKKEPSLINPSIYVMTAVMQQKACELLPSEFPRVRFLAFRMSTNSYTGLGGSDTGNRLFGI